MTIEYYRGMLTQETRMEAFRRRLLDVVQPGDRVLEIGTGLGTYSMFAAEAGAQKVWAVEGGPIVSVAQAIARLNGYADKIEFVRGWFPTLDVPTGLDVVIFEDYPPRLIDDWTHGVLRHVHERVLKSGGRMIPERARLCLAPVHAADYLHMVGSIAGAGERAYGIDWTPSRDYVVNKPLHLQLAPDDVRGEPVHIAEVRMDSVPNAVDLAGQAEWTFGEETVITGFGYWFELEVGDGVWLTNAPGGDPGSWGHLYLPLDEPWTVAGGSPLTAGVAPEVRSDGRPGWLTWSARTGDRTWQAHEFKSFPASLGDLVPATPTWTPQLTDDARAERRVLALVDGSRTVEQIAGQMVGTMHALSMADAVSLVQRTLTGRTTESSRTATG